MKILIFTEGTIIMHSTASGHSRKEIVKQSRADVPSVNDFGSYVPIGGAAEKLAVWKKQGADILYLTSRRKPREIKQVKAILNNYGFPDGQLLFRRKAEDYKAVVERILPDVLIEDDCESIGGADEMAITHIKPKFKKKITSIVLKEFAGIDSLPDMLSALINP